MFKHCGASEIRLPIIKKSRKTGGGKKEKTTIKREKGK